MAYLAGNKGQAKQLSMEGRAANERMHAAHAAAASAIYQQRNPSGDARRLSAPCALSACVTAPLRQVLHAPKAWMLWTDHTIEPSILGDAGAALLSA